MEPGRIERNAGLQNRSMQLKEVRDAAFKAAQAKQRIAQAARDAAHNNQ